MNISRVVVFANNIVGVEILKFLRQTGVEIAAVFLHPLESRKFGNELVSAASGAPIFESTDLKNAEGINRLQALRPELGISAYFGQLLRPECLAIFSSGVINLHPSYLPYNRGAYPNVWSIVDKTPAGVSLHYIDAGVDTGDVIAQRRVEVTPQDTGQTLHARLEAESIALFRELWPNIRSGKAGRVPQADQDTQTHPARRKRDIEKIDEIDLNRFYRAGDLIDLIRARTFPPHKGCFFVKEGVRVYLELKLTDSLHDEGK